MEHEITPKVSFKDKITGFFDRLKSPFAYRKRVNQRKGEIEARQSEAYNRYLKSVSPTELGQALEDIKKAGALCERALKIASMRATYSGKQLELSNKLHELEKVEKMTEEEKEEVGKLLQRYRHSNAERLKLRGQIIGFDKILDHLELFEAQIPSAIESMRDAEQKQRLARRDISYIEGERGELEFSRENIQKGMNFVYKMTLGIIVVFVMFFTIALTLYFRRDIEFFTMGLVGAIAIIIFTTILYIFKRRMVYESKLNVLLQMRAVELLNRKKIILAYYTSFLNFEYKKYRVTSAEGLKNSWEEYGLYKHLTSRYDSIRNIVYTVEDDLTAILKEKGITNTKTSLEHMEQILDFENTKRLYNNTMQELAKVELNLDPLDNEQSKIWEELNLLKERDETEDGIVGKMIQEYFEHIDHVMPLTDEELIELQAQG